MARRTYQLAIGELVGKSFGIYFRNLLPFLAISALFLSPWIALTLYSANFMAEAATDQEVDSTMIVGLAIGAFVLQTVLGFMMAGALTYGVVQQLRGQPAGIGAALSQGLQSFARVFGTALLCGVRIILFTLLLYIPGIIEQVRLYVAIPASVMEGISAGSAVERSKWLTDGSRWQIFGAWMLVALLSVIVIAIVGFLVATTGTGIDAENPWLEIGGTILVTPFGATMAATTYFLLRMGKENVDAKELAAVFD